MKQKLRRFTGLLIACSLAMSAHISVAQDAPTKQSVNNLRLWHSPDNTRVVFDVSADVVYKTFPLSNPRRLVVDIENADQSFQLPTLDVKNQHIAALRSGQPKAGVLRFVFELKKPLTQSSFILSPNELYGHRLVVDFDDPSLASLAPTSIERTAPTSSAASPGAAEPAPSVSISSSQLATQSPIIVAIDAGHGGEDPGAIGYRGSHEKKITLSIAERLKKIIDDDPRMQSYMVRRGDYYIKLHKRRQLAHANGADIFISIHADAFKKRSARGFSVFALSQRGATSAMASALAAKENASDSIGGVSLADKDEVLAKVLVDLSMTNTIGESVNLGGRVLKELRKLGKLHSRRVEQAGFAVLKSADIPSILIETGFITNPEEERNLRSSAYQGKLAHAIYTAINEYYQQTPYSSRASYASPSINSASSTGSAKRDRPKYHKVVRGDSLSKIAQRYGVGLTELKRINRLKSNVAKLGVRLKLPANARDDRPGQQAKNAKPAVHVVKRGDSLSKISANYNVTIKALRRENKLSSNTVYQGQKIKIPGAAAVKQKRKPRYHTVKRGDTLSQIAQKYKLSMQRIVQENKLRTRTVMLGQKLAIPYD